MDKQIRIIVKLGLVIVLTVLLIWLIDTDKNVLQIKQPEGEFVPSSDVWILVNELELAGAKFENGAMEEIHTLTQAEEYLSYHTYLKILDSLMGGTEQIYEKEKILYKNKYKEEFLVLKKDWYKGYEGILASMGLLGSISEQKVEILCNSEQLVGERGISEGSLLGKNLEEYLGVSEDFMDLSFVSVKAYVRGNRLLTLTEVLSDKSVLENVWIMEEEENRIQFFYEGFEILGEYAKAGERQEGEISLLREQVGNIIYQESTISDITIKEDRISGKLLSISEGQLEIEGYGILEINQENVGYKLYEKLEKAEWSDLMLGYDFADFVLENGKVCAFLLARKEKMETIRVVLKSTGFSSVYHESIRLLCQEPMTIYYGDYENRMQEKVEAGQEITIEAGSDYLSGARMEIVPEVNTAKIQVASMERSQGVPAYRGRMEIVKTKEGLVLINEVLLEEYLYSVVPSEMPASYPIEALKAQAVCARTYGYGYLLKPGYAALGAHVDDSVGYQVYNNIAENVNSTKAVKETAGELLLYEGEPVNAYYYSTSCGFGADAGVWNEEQREQFPYLNPVYIGKTQESQLGDGEKVYTTEELSVEDNFREYITGTDENAYETNEPWFRWNYQVDNLDVSMLSNRISERFHAAPGKILTFAGESGNLDDPELYESKEPKEFKKVYEIRCVKRKEGGVIDEILIETDKGTYKVISEYNIRYVLNQGGDVIRQDGSPYTSNALLPSAYLIIDVVKEDKNVIGYTIIGGGYGHGVGMSQNGARAMGLAHEDCESILSFYFQGSQLNKLY